MNRIKEIERIDLLSSVIVHYSINWQESVELSKSQIESANIDIDAAMRQNAWDRFLHDINFTEVHDRLIRLYAGVEIDPMIKNNSFLLERINEILILTAGIMKEDTDRA